MSSDWPQTNIRLLQESDELVALTQLLHRAYGALSQMGFNYVAALAATEVAVDTAEGASHLVRFMSAAVIDTLPTHSGLTRITEAWCSAKLWRPRSLVASNF
jgi:hypothetical protein